MRAQSIAEQDRAASVAPTITPAAPWRVRRLEVRPDFELLVEFNDGVSGVVRMKSFVGSKTAGEFRRLAAPDEFSQARVEVGAVTWPGGLDLAPDAMYDAIVERSEFIPR